MAQKKPLNYVHGQFFGRMDVDIDDLSDATLQALRDEINEELRRRRKLTKKAGS